MSQAILSYNATFSPEQASICNELAKLIETTIADAAGKIWHGHPVWFLEGNPIVGYHVLKNYVSLLFWSGQSFNEPLLQKLGKFKAAELRITAIEQINNIVSTDVFQKAIDIQWDYKNVVKRKGGLEKLKGLDVTE